MLAVHANHRRTNLHLGAGAGVGPQLVPGCHGPVGNSRDPIRFTCRLERNRTLKIPNPRHTARRIVICGGRCRER